MTQDKITPEEWEHADDADLRALPEYIRRARGGCNNAGRRLIEIFWARVKSGKPAYPELLIYFADCFETILDGEQDIARALNLKNPRNRPESDPQEDMYLAMEVHDLTYSGVTDRKAIDHVSKKTGCRKGKVAHAYRKHKDFIEPALLLDIATAKRVCLLTRQGHKLDEAVNEVAMEVDCDKDKVLSAWKAHKSFFARR